MAKSPQQIKDKWQRNMRGATADIRAGVEGVTEAPGVKAAASKDRMRARLLASIDSGKWERNVASVSLADWKKAFLTKGLDRIPAGVDAAAGVVQQFHEQQQAHIASYMPQLEAMANVNLDDAAARMLFNMNRMAEFTFTK